MLLQGNQRSKLDETEDTLFYAYPRFVTHVDEGFIDQLTQLYRDRIPPESQVLDLMSSWVSHLPDDVKFAHVEGHGMNGDELARNRQLDHYFIQDLNKNPKLPLGDREFDAVSICVSVQYLQYPEAVFQEMHRVLKPGGIAIVSFSNRMFFQKAIAAWREATEAKRVKLVEGYFNSVRSGELPGFSVPEAIVRPSITPPVLQMLGLGGGDPFYAVIAHRQI
ncbi:MAG: class I SAM-dependent methyltransferase [Limnospira sp.]